MATRSRALAGAALLLAAGLTGCSSGLGEESSGWSVCAEPVGDETGPGLQRALGVLPLANTGEVTIESVELLGASGMSLLGAWVVPIAPTPDGGTLAFGSSPYPPEDLDPELVQPWVDRQEVGPVVVAGVGADGDPHADVVIAVRRDGVPEARATGVRVTYRGGWPVARHHDIGVEIRLADACTD